MQIKVNGELRKLPEGITIERLLNLLQVRHDAVAVEVNRMIMSRSRHAVTCLQEGDVVEIVTFVGGG